LVSGLLFIGPPCTSTWRFGVMIT